MANPVVKFQSWTGTAWNWGIEGPGTPYTELETLRDAWVASVNLNPSQAADPIVKLKGFSDSTNGYRGWVYRIPQVVSAAGKNMYWMNYTSNATSRIWSASATWTDTTDNGGYGDPGNDPDTGSGSYQDSKSWTEVGTSSDYSMLVAYDSTDGEEFFTWGYNLYDDFNQQEAMVIFKDTTGSWQWLSWDGNIFSANHMAYDVDYDRWASRGVSSYMTSTEDSPPVTLRANVGTVHANQVANVVEPRRVWGVAANQNLMYTSYIGDTAAYATHPDGDAYVKVARYGPAVRYTST